MVEYASVRSSLYDIDSLVSQLNERSGDGWEVVQILPTGGDVTAVLRRSDEPVAEAGADDTAGVAGDRRGGRGSRSHRRQPDVAEAAVVEEIEADPVTEEPVVEEIGRGRGDVVEEPVVEEPAGWAAAPVVADTVAEPETRGRRASAADTSTYARSPRRRRRRNPSPWLPLRRWPPSLHRPPRRRRLRRPRPLPSIPAGWYPDPSGRFELRYWDGNAWSEHAARQGQMYTDPPVA